MSDSDLLRPLRAPIGATQKLIEQLDNQGVIIGGVAVALLGRPRMTADADAMVLLPLEDVPHLLALAQDEGVLPRIENPTEFASRSRVVLLRHVESGINIDISLGLLPFEVETVQRSQEYRTDSLLVRLPTPEDLIILKAVAHRPKDMLDIETIITVQQEMDKARIAFWVQQFADLLEAPEIWTDVERLLHKAE